MQATSFILLGLQLKILSCHINPWFIPQKKVKGFEIILYTGKVADPKYVAEVKQKCVEELRESAMKQDLLGKAEINARENLKSFFSLLLGNPVKELLSIYLVEGWILLMVMEANPTLRT